MASDIRNSFRRVSQSLLLAIGFAVLVAINAVSLWLVTRAQSSYEQVQHTLTVENQLSTLLLTLRRAESTQRGYLLTAAPEYLSDFQSAADAVPPLLDEVRKRTADNPDQQRRIENLAVPIERRLGDLAAVVEAQKTGGSEAALATMRASAGRADIEAAREVVQGMINEETRLLGERNVEADNTVFRLFAVNLLGSLLILGLGLAAILLVRNSNRERDEAQQELKATNIDLEASIAERTSELEEANQELQRYAYIVSHDLRSPLVNIMGFTTELESLREEIFTELAARKSSESATHADDDLKRNYDEALGFIKSSIHKMDGLIHAILKLSREGQRQFKPERLNMNEFFNEITATVAHQIDQAGASVTVAPLPEMVSDKVALEQIFSNLVDNAIKYLDPAKPGHIEITGRRVLSHVVYEIADNGRGIPENDHRRIFDLFRRSGAQDRPGEGIGLAHVRALVRRLGGRISVKSEVGEGSTFIVTLPQQWSPARERSAA